MIGVLSAAALASLTGSGHCVAMCGALSVMAGQGGRLRLQLWFHAARVGVYALLGAAAGAVGHGLDSLGSLAGVERVASLATALFVIAAVVSHLVPMPELKGPRALVMRLLRSVTSPAMRAALLGSATAFVPCGWLYVWLASAAAMSGALEGSALMAVFGLGSVPVLLGANSLAGWLRRGPLALHPRLVAASAIALLLGTVAIRGMSIAHLHDAFAADPTVVPTVCHGGLP